MTEDLDIRFHLKRDGLFLCFDRHGESDDFFLGEFDGPFVCMWDGVEELRKWKRPTDELAVSVNGRLI